MHPRHRSPGNGYRSSPMGIGGVAAASRISPESSIRGHGMYNSDYRSYNRGFGRGQPKPYQAPPAPPPPPPLPPRRPDIFMEAGRLATEYLVSKGFLPPNVLSGRMQNGSFRNQIGEFQGFRPQEGDSLHLTPDGRTSALARLGSASDTGSGRRRFGDDYNNPTGSRSFMRGRRRMESFKNYGGSDLGQGMGRSASFPDKARATSDMEGDADSFSGYPEEQQLGYRGSNDGQMSEAAPKTDGAGDSKSGLEKSQFQDDTSTKVSSDIEKDCPPENDVELAKKSDDVNLLNEDIVELNDGTSSEQVEKQSEMKDAPIQQLAMEGDPINKNGGGLLSLCGFAKIPTRTRSSLTARGPKVDPVPTTEDIKKCDQGQEDDNCNIGPPMGSEVPVKDVSVDSSSVDALSNQIQHAKCLDSDIIGTPVIMSAEDAGELGPVYTEQGKYSRSESYPDSSFIKKQEPSEGPPGFGSSSSMIMEERGKKRTAEQHTDSREGTKKPREWVLSVDAESDKNLHISHVTGKQLTSQEERNSPRDEMIFAKDQERPVDMSPFQSGNAGACIEYSEEKQLFPSSFKICDLNLMEASEIIENSDRDPLIGFHSISEIKTEATPVDVDLSISNNCNISGKFGRRGSDGKEVEVIDLENDSRQDDNALNNTERKEETVFTGFESFPNHAQSTNDISDPQDGYGLMFSELLGTDISNCPSVPADIGSLHNDMALHNGEGILGDDESIYMSLGEIPISMPEL